MAPRAACIDIGSNTTRLLVAEPDGPGRVREVLCERVFTRIGAAERTGGIGDERVAQLAGIVRAQAALASEEGATHLRAVATGALRDAPNGAAAVAAISRAAGVPIEVLPGIEEARLAFLGAMAMLDTPPEGLVAVVDVGGGSTELAMGTAGGGVRTAVSLPVGSGVLTDEWLSADPPTARHLEDAARHCAAVRCVEEWPPAQGAWAVGGSAASLRRIVGDELSGAALERALAAIVAGSCDDVARRYGLARERVRLLPAGLVILREVARSLRCPLHLGGGGLREGVVLELLHA